MSQGHLRGNRSEFAVIERADRDTYELHSKQTPDKCSNRSGKVPSWIWLELPAKADESC